MTSKNHPIGILLIVLLFSGCNPTEENIEDIPNTATVPNPYQYEYQKQEMIGFIHFTVNTFTDKEWGYGDEDPAIFNPEQLDAEQWVLAAKAAGIREMILTAKHHDGFCLWPSKFTEHSVKNSPYKNGQGDIVREFVDACKKHGLKTGLYLSPWDRNHAAYGTPEYLVYYRNQLQELLTTYGEINEIWFDGANGGDGYYGGANEERRIDKESYYEWDSTIALVKKLQPGIKIFSNAGPDIRWVGNENGFAGETFWSTINKEQLVIGGSDQKYLNTGEEGGNSWIIGQCDVSIRPGWFYHANQDSLVKSPQEILDIYYKSVGRNGVLLLNLPPQPNGLIHETDVANLKEFKRIIDETFMMNFASGKKVLATNQRLGSDYFSPDKITDNDPESYWACDDKVTTAELIIDLDASITFDRILIQEPTKYGQRIKKFEIQIAGDDGTWKTITEGTTIGYKRLLRFPISTAQKVKLILTESLDVPAISNFEIYKASSDENS